MSTTGEHYVVTVQNTGDGLLMSRIEARDLAASFGGDPDVWHELFGTKRAEDGSTILR